MSIYINDTRLVTDALRKYMSDTNLKTLELEDDDIHVIVPLHKQLLDYVERVKTDAFGDFLEIQFDENSFKYQLWLELEHHLDYITRMESQYLTKISRPHSTWYRSKDPYTETSVEDSDKDKSNSKPRLSLKTRKVKRLPYDSSEMINQIAKRNSKLDTMIREIARASMSLYGTKRTLWSSPRQHGKSRSLNALIQMINKYGFKYNPNIDI